MSLILILPIFLLYCDAAHRHLHSFPTRRSSDLTSPLSGARSSHLSYRPQHRRGNVHNYLIVRWFSDVRSEEHTSELQSLTNLVCRLLLEKKNKKKLNKYICKYHIKLFMYNDYSN